MARVPSYRLHKPTGQAVVTLSGKDFYLGKFNSKVSKKAYDLLLKEWESTGRSTSFGRAPEATTIAMLVSDFRDWAESYYPMNGKDSEAKQIKIATEWLSNYEDLPVTQFGPLKLKAVRDAMIKTTGKHGKPLSRTYINDMIERIRRMFGWGVENEIVPPVTYQALKAVKGLRMGRTTAPDSDPVQPVAISLVEATLPHCSPTVAAMIRVQQLTGARPGEVCQLTPGMIDRNRDVWIARLAKHKTMLKGKKREIYFGPQAQTILRPFLLRPADQPLFSPAESEKWRLEQRHAARVIKEGYGNCRGSNKKSEPKYQPGDRYDTCSYRRAIWYAVAKAFPLPKDASTEAIEQWKSAYRWSPNQIRHLTATEIRNLFGLEAAQVYLGHCHADTTQIYAETNREKGIAVARVYG